MFRYFIKLAYNGSSFHGWQHQPNAVSVQDTIEQAMRILLKQPIALCGCGRTDTGVHASCFFAHFDIDTMLTIDDQDQLRNKLNRFLDASIVIYDILAVKPDAHARFSALSRTYHYYVSTIKDPFSKQSSLFFPFTPDVAQMNKAAKILLQTSDFTSFAKLHSDTKTNICKVTHAAWIEVASGKLMFVITADRFLRNMVRSIVGTLLDVGIGKISLENYKQIIEDKERSSAGESVKAHGLFLAEVTYPEDFLL